MLSVLDKPVLHEAVLAWTTEYVQKICAIIMVAHHQVNRNREFFQPLLQRHIGLDIARVR